MRYVTFADHSGSPRPAVVEGDRLKPLSGVSTLIDYIALDEEARKAVAFETPVPLHGARLLAPVKPAKNVFCVGRNYMGHAEEVAKARGVPLSLPDVPTFFTKAPTAIVGPDVDLELSPDISSEYDYEVELAVVIGKRCRDVAERDALGAIFGYTIVNDVTARDLQKAHHQWFKGKTLDNTCPIGPWIVDANDVGDPQTVDVSLRVNGTQKQHASTSTMIFSVARIVAELSKGMTLEPGDVIATGTPDGVGFARTPPEFLKDGDVMELEIQRIGVLKNTIRLTSRVLEPVGAGAHR